MPRWPLPSFHHQWEPLFPSLLIVVSHSFAADSEKVWLHCMWLCFSWSTAACSWLLLRKSNICINQHLKFRTFLTCSNNYCKNSLLACLSSLHPAGMCWFFFCLFYCIRLKWQVCPFRILPNGSLSYFSAVYLGQMSTTAFSAWPTCLSVHLRAFLYLIGTVVFSKTIFFSTFCHF